MRLQLTLDDNFRSLVRLLAFFLHAYPLYLSKLGIPMLGILMLGILMLGILMLGILISTHIPFQVCCAPSTPFKFTPFPIPYYNTK